MDPRERHVRSTASRLLATVDSLLELNAVDLKTALEQAAQAVAEVYGADKVDVLLYDASIDCLVAVGTSDTPMGRLEHQLGLHELALSKGGRTVHVYTTGESFVSGDAMSDPYERRDLIEGLGVQSMVATPLAADGERFGVLLLCSAHPGRYGEDDLVFLRAVGRWLAIIRSRMAATDRLAEAAARAGYQAAAEEAVAALTPRQREVSQFLAEGLTNQQIAARLVLQPGTVANHVEHILRRLGFSSRSQVAALMGGLGLPSANAIAPAPRIESDVTAT